MPKVLIYSIWIFLFYGRDKNENRAHVHVGRKDTENLTKVWLEPEVEIAKEGDLTYSQQREVLRITQKYQKDLLKQWEKFKKGQQIKIIKTSK